ncbi:hypothetical protein DAETH_05850 [Deinococcus aetherius]|uniref:SpoVT-AbrB domain-containing protein n=1 Tax=Deinococcus aetherius TaxID=200252 RepID=A0ABN6RFZ6_9DEIO|nr:hypothetical protein DAETH_05850 [Deinococcus aetherius]
MQTFTATIGCEGEIILPPELCERLGVGQGDEIEFVLDDQGVHLRPKRQEDNPFLAWVGAIPLTDGETTEQWLRETRHERRRTLHPAKRAGSASGQSQRIGPGTGDRERQLAASG